MTVFWIVVGVLFVVWVLMNLKTSRPDGEHIAKVHPYRTMMGYLMPTRNESVVYFDDYVLAEPLLEYIEQARKRFHCDVTHCIVGAVGSAYNVNPKMNQFIAGRRLYQRKGIWVSFSLKRKKLDQKSKISVVKTELEPGRQSFYDLCRFINEKIGIERSDAKTYTDKELDVFLNLPRPLLIQGVRFFRWLDHHNLLPAGFIKGDPMYCSMFIANLGSVRMRAGYHHLYEWGNCPLFMMVGRIEEKPWVVDGEIQIRKVLHIRWSYDERIDDGFTASKGINAVNLALSQPHRFLGCLSEDGSDDHPLAMSEEDYEGRDRTLIP